jgi:hypothetical protein
VPREPAATLWWTLRRPLRPLTYHAARAMLNRANALLGAKWILHDLRHTAAYRMARDPKLALTDVQWVLGHAHLTTTQIYVSYGRDEIVEAVRATPRAPGAAGPDPGSAGSRISSPDPQRPVRRILVKARIRHVTSTPAAGPGERLPVPQAAGGPLEQARAQFPARAAGAQWPMTCKPAQEVLAALQMPPYDTSKSNTGRYRFAGARAILSWLAGFPGTSWQERWEVSPAACPRQWAEQGQTWVASASDVTRWSTVQAGLLTLAGADVVRLPLAWLVGHRSTHLRQFFEEVRDPAGFARLETHVDPGRWSTLASGKARLAPARILVARGGGLADITVGDAIEYDTAVREAGGTRSGCGSTLFCSWPRELGHLPADAPTTLRLLGRVTGQLTCEQLVDRHGVASAPIRGLPA